MHASVCGRSQFACNQYEGDKTKKENARRMILEVAMLTVKAGLEGEFEVAFKKASAIIAAQNGYLGHQLQRCIEVKGKYLLLVQWTDLESHTAGFRESEAYQQWKALLHHFYEPFPTVEHFEEVSL